MAITRNPRNIPVPSDPEYQGKRDYQGNHDVFEMPEDQKPVGRSVSKLPLNKIALGVIIIGAIVLLFLVCASIIQQTAVLR